MKEEINEKSLLQGLARNERIAAETIYRDNFNMVQSLVINNNGTAEDARDIFQEAMIVLYENVKKSDFELNCQIKTYVYSVCRRLWLKRLQQVGRYSIDVDNADGLVQVEEDVENHEKRNTEFEMMDIAISKLGEPCKSLIEAF